MNIVVVDSGVNKSHKIFKQDNINILSLQYIDGNITRSNEDNDLFGHGTAISGIISRCNADIKITVIGISDLADGLDEETLIFCFELYKRKFRSRYNKFKSWNKYL